MKIAAFDLEIAREFPDKVDDLKRFAPLGITCAAVAFSDESDLLVWQGVPQLSREECQAIVHKLRELVAAGYTLVTWNGCKFDFFVLAQESGMVEECGELALGHVDLMAIVTFTRGHFLGLEKALKGAGLAGKNKRVKLSDGTVLHGMSGARAPALWAAGEHEAVLAYLREDVLQLVELASFVDRTKAIYWRSNADAPQAVDVKKLKSVKECFGIPEPDVSWMSNPPSRQSFVDWIPGW